ncbi:MAG: U32 family peptidase [Thermoguttaceae bacterium]|nr:U32 family peptidase [Thermoguttaceae bacterium]MDW8037962.1 U32 family peptidase [Thermoguttaceae bacterium]
MAMELLAPAGDWACLEAAVRAGADAVYFGFGHLNARRRAKNFTEPEASQAVQLLHQHGRRAYLTLNIDLATRELGLALHMLRTAAQAGFDAVLVRDPALLAVRPAFPTLEFHFSTQTCMANSADVAAAQYLGAQRVVLAREMTLEEIAAASRVPGIQTEVFAQGALCFSVSGRCLMSSWVGGRSGNRGLCASPCRAPWTVEQQPAGNPFSMHDLCTLDWLDRLQQAGVSGLKIEGRLKSPGWVEQAVRIYRQALQGQAIEPLKSEAQRLTDYTGRQLTDGYLAGQRTNLTGSNRGRQPQSFSPPPEDSDQTGELELPTNQPTLEVAPEGQSPGTAGSGRFRFLLSSAGPAISCHLWIDQQELCWQYPKSVIHRAHKAVSAGSLCAELEGSWIQGVLVESATTDDPDFLLVRRTANAIVDRISTELSRWRRAAVRPVPLSLPPQSLISEAELEPASVNIRPLGDPPNCVRLHKNHLESFLRLRTPVHLIVEGVEPEDVNWIAQACRSNRPVVALPAVCFEGDLPWIRELVSRCKKARLAVEVNSWGTWWIARHAGIAFEAGPGLGVLNPLAAAMLRKLGARTVTASLEADRRQLEDLCAAAPVGLSLYVFGRPPLAISRVELPSEYQNQLFEDRRCLRMIARRERDLWVFRPETPFEWRGLRNQRIRVKNLVVDLVASPDPVAEWLHSNPRTSRKLFYFNYHRSLQ